MSSSDTSEESAALMPEEKNYRPKVHAASSPEYEERTEIIVGDENLIQWNLRTLSTVTKSIDLCGDRYGPSIIIASKQILEKYIELHGRGVKQRVITEITKENIVHCKKLMRFQELRHLDGLKGYLGIADG